MADSIVNAVVQKFLQRSEIGQKKYGTTLDRTDLAPLDWINHAQEEFMDGILYLEKLKRFYQVMPTEIIDDRRPPSSSSSEPDDSEADLSDSYVYPMHQAYTIVCGKKRPRDEEEKGGADYQKKRTKTDMSVSTESHISPADSVQSASSPSEEIIKMSCAQQARACGEKLL
jgi:hypothetical protein